MCEITAHSGCDGMPDNSMEFVRYALASEGNCLEAVSMECRIIPWNL